MRKLTFIAALLAASFASAQTEVAPYQPGATVEGINYTLPRTALRVTVVAEKKTVTPGSLAPYAFRYLRLKDVPTESATTWSIQRVTLEPFGQPDPAKMYNVKLRPKTSAPLVSLTRDGLLLAINAEKQETVLPPLPVGMSAVTPLDPRQYLSQEVLAAGSTAKMAELCAQEIYDLRESRNELVRGQSDNLPKDGEQLRLMLQQIDTQDQALMQLFQGYTQTSTEVHSFIYVPTEATQRAVLFRFSEREGFVEADDLLGAPVYVSVAVTPLPASVDNPDAAKKKAKLQQEQGIFYNVPARAKVTVFDLNRELASIDAPFAQFGNVEILSNALFDKHMTTRVLFHQHTGGVEKVE